MGTDLEGEEDCLFFIWPTTVVHKACVLIVISISNTLLEKWTKVGWGELIFYISVNCLVLWLCETG